MDVCCECCVLSGRGLCDELITRPDESYWKDAATPTYVLFVISYTHVDIRSSDYSGPHLTEIP